MDVLAWQATQIRFLSTCTSGDEDKTQDPKDGKDEFLFHSDQALSHDSWACVIKQQKIYFWHRPPD
ncbi:MAG TPA: hypothetical protein DCM28_21455 [Phycisphaerales bacterium]|nr:hypothetical protein [Phycisphaerales bacterium]HCD34845.1 hypothetical protein [Phycisphaerales bacterium]